MVGPHLAAMAEADLKAGLDAESHQALEEEFADVLGQMGDDPALAPFRAEYEKLHASLVK